jgi:rhodanese-related sulfurtransferase
MKTATVREVYDLIQQGQREGRTVDLFDVRTPLEFAEVHAVGAINFPLNSLDPIQCITARKGLPTEPLYLICRSGGRSEEACEIFTAAGYPDVVNVVGGTRAWMEAALPVADGLESPAPGASSSTSCSVGGPK